MTGGRVQHLQSATAASPIYSQAAALSANGLVRSSSTVPIAQRHIDTCSGCMMGNMSASSKSARHALCLCLCHVVGGYPGLRLDSQPQMFQLMYHKIFR